MGTSWPGAHLWGVGILLLTGCGGNLVIDVEQPFTNGDSTAGTEDTHTPSTEVVPGVEDPEIWLAFDPPGATFTQPISVTLSSLDEATITYTTNGSLPVPGRDAVYSGAIPMATTTTLRAIATFNDQSTEVTSRSFMALEDTAADFTSNLPLIVLHTFEDAPTYKTEERTLFTVNVLEPGDNGRTSLLSEASLSLRAGLKVRGSSTNGQPKPHYSLELWGNGVDDDHDASVLDMPAESDWVLHAPLYFDRALIRNALIYQLSNDIDRYAPRTRFVELYVTDHGQPVRESDYVGVYVVMERIKRNEERVDIERLATEDLEEPEVSGGYIFKRDRTDSGEDGFRPGTAGGAFSFSQPLVWVEPAEDEVADEQEAWLSSYIDAFAIALSAPDHFHPASGQPYSDWIDVSAWIDHHLLNVLTMNPDAFRLSGFFFKDREDRIHAGPLWDFDRTMGCASDSRASDPTHWDASYYTSDTTYVFEHGWYEGLFDDPEYAETYWNRWREVIDGELSLDQILARIDEMAEELSEAAPRNFDKWRDYPPRGDGTFDYEVEYLRSWLTERHDWIRDCLDLPDPERCG